MPKWIAQYEIIKNGWDEFMHSELDTKVIYSPTIEEATEEAKKHVPKHGKFMNVVEAK